MKSLYLLTVKDFILVKAILIHNAFNTLQIIAAFQIKSNLEKVT